MYNLAHLVLGNKSWASFGTETSVSILQALFEFWNLNS